MGLRLSNINYHNFLARATLYPGKTDEEVLAILNPKIKVKRQVLVEKYINPKEIKINSSGGFIRIWKNKYGEIHSFNGQPSITWHNKNKEAWLKEWYKNDKHIKSDY